MPMSVQMCCKLENNYNVITVEVSMNDDTALNMRGTWKKISMCNVHTNGLSVSTLTIVLTIYYYTYEKKINCIKIKKSAKK